jgi:hypothetical protein
MSIHINILDEARKKILPLLKFSSAEGFYLAGGTGIALQIGHRDSIDFDFFKEGSYDTSKLLNTITEVFRLHKIIITQQEKNTLTCLIDDSISLSFFGYNHSLLEPLIKTDYFSIASITDIACMKFSAITSRWLEKDYVDIYFILQRIKLKTLLAQCEVKYPMLDTNLILKSLVYFEDITEEPILFKEGNEVSFEDLKKNLKIIVKDYFLDNLITAL